MVPKTTTNTVITLIIEAEEVEEAAPSISISSSAFVGASVAGFSSLAGVGDLVPIVAGVGLAVTPSTSSSAITGLEMGTITASSTAKSGIGTTYS